MVLLVAWLLGLLLFGVGVVGGPHSAVSATAPVRASPAKLVSTFTVDGERVSVAAGVTLRRGQVVAFNGGSAARVHPIRGGRVRPLPHRWRVDLRAGSYVLDTTTAESATVTSSVLVRVL